MAGVGVDATASALLTGVELDEIIKYGALGAGAGAIMGVLARGDQNAGGSSGQSACVAYDQKHRSPMTELRVYVL